MTSYPGRQRAHVDHRRVGRGWRRTDQGRRRHQRCRQRDARGGRHPGRAGRARADRLADRRRGPADRPLAPRHRPSPASSTRRRTRSSAASRRAGSATPIRTSSRTRRSTTADGAIAIAVGSERQWPRLCAALGAAGAGSRSALCDQRRPRRGAGGAPPAAGGALRHALDRGLARRARRGRHPVRADQRRPRGVRLAGGARRSG